MKQILFIGDLNTYSRSYHIYQALTELPYSIKPLSYAPIGEISEITKPVLFLHKVLAKLGYRIDTTSVNQKMLDYIKRVGCPDLLFINQGLTVKASTIR